MGTAKKSSKWRNLIKDTAEELRNLSEKNNTKCQQETLKEEQQERLDIIKEHLKIYQKIFPDLIEGFKEIEDPRNPNKIEHKLIAAFMYGMFLFILKIPSRRQANKILTKPKFIENLNTIFPELKEVDDLPHGDTVNEILNRIPVEKIQDIHMNLIKDLIYSKTFEKYKNTNGYLINIDGTQKLSSEKPLSQEALKRKKETKTGKKVEYYVYVLEANLVFEGGLSLPLLTEFCEFSKGNFENNKQDCELTAFKRLASRLKNNFSHLPITLSLDGLYACGPIFRLCRKNHWSFMITLKDDDLIQVWRKARGRKKIGDYGTCEKKEEEIKQNFWWVNNIEYRYGNNKRFKETVHLVVCEETNKKTNETKKFVWISSKPIHKHNVTLRCNKIGRPRWLIEEDIQVEKHHEYQAQHLFSQDWQAMKAFHYLMRIVRLLDILCYYSIKLYKKIQQKGLKNLVYTFTTTLTATLINKVKMRKFLNKKHYLQLINI